jgi:glycosyltransferase involved in cell wall biosynthesis
VFTLVVLAYNEEKYIEKTILELIEYFDKIIVVDDKSSDNTSPLVEALCDKHKNIKLIKNAKNFGAGKSFLTAIKLIEDEHHGYIIKVDGDNQFNLEDILKLKEISKNKNIDFLKCDRFWENGIKGDIPLIRYVGNAFASLLLKLSTSNWKLNDPLNGLFSISTKAAKHLNMPKLFFRYGYPFYLSVYFSNLSIERDLLIGQMKNTVTYRDEKSNLKAFTMLFKLVYFTFKTLFSKIKLKMKYSQLQMSAILDILGAVSFITFMYSIIKFLNIRYFDYVASQATWFLVSLIFLVLTISLVFVSQKIEYKIKLTNFINEN